jgi:predicted phosphodiesterase
MVFSDVHANIEALEAIFAHAGSVGRPDQVWCLGDLVGYGPDPGRCIDRIRGGFDGIPIICIRGNHDDGVVRASLRQSLAEHGGVSVSIRESWNWTARQLTAEQLAVLRGLPLTQVVNGLSQSVLLVHAAPPDDIGTYLLAARTIEARLGQLHQRLCCFGHTHLPSYFECELATLQVKPRLFTPISETIHIQGDRILLNPGAVGQPRWGALSDGSMSVTALSPDQAIPPYPRKLDGVPAATYLWLNLDGDQISATCHFVPYDADAVITKLKGLSTYRDVLNVPERWLNRLTTGLR